MKSLLWGSVFSLLVSTAPAAEFFQAGNMGPAENWNDALWEMPAGAASVPSSGCTYVNNLPGSKTRTGIGKDNAVFAGGSLELRAAGSMLALKGSDSTVNLIMHPGTHVVNAGVPGGGGTLSGTVSAQGSGMITFDAGRFGRHTTVEAQLSAGTGITEIQLICGAAAEEGRARKSGTVFRNGSNTFSGTWNVRKGYLVGASAGSLGQSSFRVEAHGLLDFDYDFSNEHGTLEIAAGGVLDLDQDLVFGSVVIWGKSLPAGTHSVKELMELGVDAEVLEEGLSSTGSITVSAPPKPLGLIAGAGFDSGMRS